MRFTSKAGTALSNKHSSFGYGFSFLFIDSEKKFLVSSSQKFGEKSSHNKKKKNMV